VEISVGNAGLKMRSKVMINQTRAVDKARLIKKMGRVTPAILNEVNRALKLHYGL
jgi:mRNA-degrading endonuclease toxin of MazEF toxin-antitoxin module